VEPETATSGAGGAGGLIILSTRSLRSLYSGLVVKFSGGLYVDALGSTRQSRSGMVVNYYNPTAYITAVNATQFCTLLTTSVLSQNVLDNIPTPVQLFNLTRNLGVQFNDTTNQITVSESGTYLVSVSIPTSSSAPGEFTCWLRRNNDTTTLYGQVTAQQIIALSTQINLDAGDTLMVMVYQNSGGTLTLNSSPSAPISLSLNHISFL
jgi:Na+/H+ antiporter NhaD/arsenite permease-like protein